MLQRIVKGIAWGVLMVGLFLALVYGFMLLWNVTIPDIFGVRSLTYGYALRLLIISRVLIGGFGFRWSNSNDKKRFWRERMNMKMEKMTEEEKEEFKRKLWKKCNDC